MQWLKADLAETSEVYRKPLLNSSVKNSIIFTVFNCNEFILFLLQKFVHLLNEVFYFVLLVFCHAVDIIACAPDEIDVVDESGLRLIEPTNKDSDRVDVSLWFQGVWGMEWEWLLVVILQVPWSL